MTAAERWTQALVAWAIPQHILDSAPVSPWGFSTPLFERRADSAVESLTPSNQRALEVLPSGGAVLDVGCGAGAAALPLAARAGHLIGVDPSASMLRAFRARAEAAGVTVTTLEGDWPAVAGQAPIADVVVCHHVAYNVQDLAAFVGELTAHAHHRVIMELTAQHPMQRLNELWLRFHGVVRPTAPTYDDALAVLREAGLAPQHEVWTAPTHGSFAERAEMVAWVRRPLCLPPERDGEIEAALADLIVEQPDGTVGFPPRPVVTVWWAGRGKH